MNIRRILVITLAAVALVFAVAASAQNRGTGTMHGQQGMMGGMMQQQGGQGSMSGMGMSQGSMGHMSHQQMMERLNKDDSQIEGLVKRMNATTGNAKIEAMAKVITALANRQNAMGQGMMAVQPQMMQSMMEHMQGGMMSGMGSNMGSSHMGSMMGGGASKTQHDSGSW